jgi:hypothetical protein
MGTSCFVVKYTFPVYSVACLLYVTFWILGVRMLATDVCIFLAWHLSALQKLRFPGSNCIQWTRYADMFYCFSGAPSNCFVVITTCIHPVGPTSLFKSVYVTGPLMLIHCLYEQIKKEGSPWIYTYVYLHSFRPNAIEVQKLYRGSVPASICSSFSMYKHIP